MPYGHDGAARSRAREQRRIEWGARRRQVQAMNLRPEQYEVPTSDPAELWDYVFRGVYVAQTAAERRADPETLASLRFAASALLRLWEFDGKPGGV